MDDLDFKSEIESYKIENENLKRENDKITVDYELKLECLKKEIHLKSSDYERLMNNYQEIEAKFKNGCDDKISLNQTYHDLSKEKFEIVKKLNTLESDYSTITELISRRENELLTAKNEIHDLRTKVDEYKTNEIEMKLKEKDVEYRRKDIDKIEEMSAKRNKRLCDDIKSLQDKLEIANTDLFNERSKNNTIVFELNVELENKRNEVKNQKKANEKLRENISYLEKVYEEKTESLRSALEGKSNLDSVLRKDLNAQKSITELYKAERDELLEKQTAFIQTITELQDAFRENCEDSTKLKEEFESKLEEYECSVSELRRSFNEKEKELENANKLLEKFRVNSLSEEDLKAMNPATAAAIGAVKRGYSLTQLYSEYLQVVAERNELKVDKDRLNEYIQTTFEGLEEKAPSLRRQQEERSNMELVVSTIGQKYERTLSDLFNVQTEAEELRKKCEELSKKLKREEQTTSDLNQQVCCLLREVETSRGTVIRSEDDGNKSMYMNRMRSIQQQSVLRQSHSSLISNNSSMDGSNRFVTANDVITTHLVTFKNICELQQQNIQLLEQLRDLSAQQEAQEGIINEQSLQQVATKLENACAEVDQLKEKVKHQRQLEKIIDRQRHIIQALTSLSGNADISLVINKGPLSLDCSDDVSQSLISCNDRDKLAASNVDIQAGMTQKIAEYEKKLSKMQATIDQLKEEKEYLKDCHAKVIEELNKQISDNKISNENLLTKLSYDQEKSNTLEQNLVNRQLEMSDLQTEMSAINIELMQKKEELKSTKSELVTSQSMVKNYETTINELRKNMKHIESLELQIHGERAEKYELMKTTNNLATQISNLQSVVVSSRAEDSGEEQHDLKSRIKQLSLDLKQEKAKYQTSQEMWQSKLNECTIKIDSLTAQMSNVGKSSVPIIVSDNRVTERQKSPEKREKMNNLEEQIEDLSLANKNLKKQLESYQEILFTSESKLLNNSELMERLQTEFQQKIDDEKKKSFDLEEVLDNFQSAHDTLECEYNAIKETFEEKINDLEQCIQDNERTIESLNSQLISLKEKESLLKSDLARQRQLTKDAMENYQQELIFHAQESDSLQESIEQLRKYQTQERELAQKLKEALLDRDQYKTYLDSKDAMYNAEKGSLQSEIEDLRKQKESLNNRLIDLNDLVVNLKKMLDPTVEGAVDQAVIQRESDWNEVIQYLRQEKENAENAKNQLEIELYRLRNENKSQEDSINQLNSLLEEERKFKLIEAETGKHHAEVMRKLETVQMLSESNAMLRKDRERLKDDLTEQLRKVASLQESVEPMKNELKSKKNELESIRLELRSLENERDLWRQRCDSLIEKSKQINPEDFKKLCVEKDDLQHKLLVDEEQCKNLQLTIDEIQQTLANQNDSLKETEASLEEMRRTNDENLNVIQKKDITISQLKEIGRKYKAEKEALQSDVSKVNELKEGQARELQKVRTDLSSTKASLDEASHQLKQRSDNSQTHQVDSQLQRANEHTMRQKIIESQLALQRSENEALRSENTRLNSLLNPVTEESVKNDDCTIELNPSNSLSHQTTHSAPTVARVAANVHPVIQKPQIQVPLSTNSNQISPSSQAMSARQTAEIRPIPAMTMHTATTMSSTTISELNEPTVSVTTSLPANVVQALAASSVSMVIFPSASLSTASTSSSSVTMPSGAMKRRLNEGTSTNAPSPTQDSDRHNRTGGTAITKKIRLQAPELTERRDIEETTAPVTSDDYNELFGYTDEHEVELTCQDTCDDDEEQEDEEGQGKEADQEDIDDVAFEESGNEEESVNDNYSYDNSEEDYNESNDDDDEDDDDDDEPECIDLLSSDGQSNDDNPRDEERNDDITEDSSNLRDQDEEEDKDESEDECTMVIDEHNQTNQESELDQAKRKIEPITWDASGVSGSNTASVSALPTGLVKRGAQKFGQIGRGQHAFIARRKTNAAPRAMLHYGPSGSITSRTRGRSTNAQFGREFPNR